MGIFNSVNKTTEKILIFVIILGFFNSIRSQNYYDEQYRPQFHFTPEKMWMNDPNGLVYQNGTYHLFYQYYPDADVWGPMHWGHATSKDLLTWKHQKIALFPDEQGYIFSGSAVVDKNNTAGFGKNAFVAVYTSHNSEIEKKGGTDFQTQSIAYSTDNGKNWIKYTKNPVMPNLGKLKDFRDPKVFWNDHTQSWQMVLAAGKEIQFFESSNLKDWKYMSSYTDDLPFSNGVWECPDLFELKADNGEKKWVLIISHGNHTQNGGSGTRYFVGDWDGKRFLTSQKNNLWLDNGSDNYAGVTFNNTSKRTLIGWMNNWQYATTIPTKGWRSAMTIPRELSLQYKNGQYKMLSKPVSSFKNLSARTLFSQKNINSDNGFSFKNEHLQTSEIDIEIDTKKDFNIHIGNDKNESYDIHFDSTTNEMFFDRSKSGRTDFNENFKNMSVHKISLEKSETIRLQIILDRSSVETFLNNGEFAITDQVFPNSNYDRIDISANGTGIKKLKIKKIKKTW